MICPTERKVDFGIGRLSICPEMYRLLTFLLTAEILIYTDNFDVFDSCQQRYSKNFRDVFRRQKKTSIRSLNPHVDNYVDSLQINFRQRQYEPLCRAYNRKEFDDYGKNDE